MTTILSDSVAAATSPKLGGVIGSSRPLDTSVRTDEVTGCWSVVWRLPLGHDAHVLSRLA